MLNKIRKLICGPFFIISGIIFGLMIWLYYGKSDLHKFCDWLGDQAKAEERAKEKERAKIKKKD